MSRTKTAGLALVSTILLATAAAFAATAPSQPANPPQNQPPPPGAERWNDEGRGRGGPGYHRFRGMGRDEMRQRRMAFRAAKDPSASVLLDLTSLEQMYRDNGREKDVPALYRDVLARTNDPVVRHLAGQRVAQLEWQNGNKDAAVEQMQKNLEADLKRAK
jgi:hypothetical protein